MAQAARPCMTTNDPLYQIERLALVHDWGFERTADDELVMSAAGLSGDLILSLIWRADLESLHIACQYASKAPLQRREEMGRLINLVNEQLLYGHFDLWRQDGSVMFRNNLLLSGDAEAGEAQCEALIRIAIETCERYNAAFQFAIWAGAPAERAIANNFFTAAGQA